MIARYRKKPVEVEAAQWTGDNRAEMHAFTDGRFAAIPSADRARQDTTAEVWDFLHSTWVGVKTGQWVIKGVKGEFYPIDEQVLAETYEPVEAG